MNIAIVVENLHTRGGVERRTFELMKCLMAAGHELHVYANRWDPAVTGGARFHRIPMLKLDRALKPLSFAWFSSILLSGNSHSLIHTQARIFRYDISTLGVGCHKAYLDAMGIDPKQGSESRFHRTILHLERAMLRPGRYRRIIMNSDMCKGEMVSNYGVPSDSVAVVHNGVDHEVFCAETRTAHREAARSALGLTSEDIAVLYVGAGFKRKGLDTLIEAIGCLRGSSKVKLLIVGRGSRSEYERLAMERGIQDRLIWVGESANVICHYAAADVFALPTRYDPFANSTMEALACGLPVVTTNRNGVSEILRDGVDAFIVSPNDPDALSERLGALVQDNGLRERLGSSGQSVVSSYSWERTAEETMEVYRSALGE